MALINHSELASRNEEKQQYEKDLIIMNKTSRKSLTARFQLKKVIAGLLAVLFACTFILKSYSFKAHVAMPQSNLVRRQVTSTSTSVAATATPKLVNFQVAPPILTPYSSYNQELVLTNGSVAQAVQTTLKAKTTCVVNQTLMVYDFANSYGTPFVGSYHPPKCSFNRITLNLTVTSQGRQYDRLGFMFFGSTELWRTSTAEPTSYGIIWTYVKDVSEYLSLFEQKQTLIFEFDNVVTGPYTGIYNATLTATFWTSEDTVNPADKIIAISPGNGAQNRSSIWTVPSDIASNSVKIPKRTNRAVFSIAACGQIDEEEWYTNVFNSDINTFPTEYGPLFGGSPFRELQLYIDGILAGVVWPFPIVFTGGIVPGLWRPIVGIDAFDLREDVIDVTPWLPHLTDGRTHTFEIRVAAIDDNGGKKGTLTPAPSYWLITGKLFLWFDPAGSITTGQMNSYNAPAPTIHLSQSLIQDANGTNSSLTYSTEVSRHLSISSTITTANGTTTSTWKQTLSYYNHGYYWNGGFSNINNQSTTGTDISSSGYKRQIQYPIYLNATLEYLPNNALYLWANVIRGQTIKIAGLPVFPSGLQNFDQIPAVKASYPTFQGSTLSTLQNGTAYYLNNGAGTIVSPGNTTQVMTLEGDQYGETTDASGYPVTQRSNELYMRDVTARNTTVVQDYESLIGRESVGFALEVEGQEVDNAELAFAPVSKGRFASKRR